MQWAYIGAGILLILVAWEANPKLGGALLALVVLVMLSRASSRGYLTSSQSTSSGGQVVWT